MYVATEDTFPVQRLRAMGAAFRARYDFLDEGQLTDRILVDHVGDLDRLEVLLETRLPKVGPGNRQDVWARADVANLRHSACCDGRASQVLEQGKVRLVVIDSIAALVRGHDDGSSVKRAKDLMRYLIF